MEKKRVVAVFCCSLFLLLSLAVGVSGASINGAGGSVGNGETVKDRDEGDIELPELGGDYGISEFVPPDLSAVEKPWHQYVEYDMNNPKWIDATIGGLKLGRLKCFYPVDHTAATIMVSKPLSMTTVGSSGSIIGQNQTVPAGEYSTASSVQVGYTVTQGFALGFSESIEVEGLWVTGSFGSTQDMNTGKEQSIVRTFNALPEPGGIVRPWRVVQYIVQTPVRVEQYYNNKLVISGYLLVNILTGTCREWADGYIEHWQTGNKVTIDNFSDFMTPDQIIELSQLNWI